MVRAHAAGDSGTRHDFADLESAARHRDPVRGADIAEWRYYTFMASVKRPWEAVSETLWRAIPSPVVDGRLVLALDYSINPNTGKG